MARTGIDPGEIYQKLKTIDPAIEKRNRYRFPGVDGDPGWSCLPRENCAPAYAGEG